MRRANKQTVSCKHPYGHKTWTNPRSVFQVLAGNLYKETGKRPLYQWALPLLLCMFFLPASFGTLWIIANANVLPSKIIPPPCTQGIWTLWASVVLTTYRRYLRAKIRRTEQTTKQIYKKVSFSQRERYKPPPLPLPFRGGEWLRRLWCYDVMTLKSINVTRTACARGTRGVSVFLRHNVITSWEFAPFHTYRYTYTINL